MTMDKTASAFVFVLLNAQLKVASEAEVIYCANKTVRNRKN